MQLQRFSVMVFAGALFAVPAMSLAVPGDATNSYHMVVKGKVKFFNERVAHTFEAKGDATIGISAIGDVDGDGAPDVATEIVSMHLTGTTTAGLAINLNSSRTNRSMGMAETLTASPRGINAPNLLLRIPVDSFFDVFTELSIQQSGGAGAAGYALYSIQKGMRVQGIGTNLTDLSGIYTQRKSGSVIILDREGNPAGTLTFLVTNLNSSRSN